MNQPPRFQAIVLAVSLMLASGAANPDNRCEADQLAAVGIYCKTLLNCTADHFSSSLKTANCENAARSAFAKRYTKAFVSAFKRGTDCAFSAELNAASDLFFNSSSALTQNSLLGWEATATKNRWYRSLLHAMASSCRGELTIESRFAKDANASKRQAALLKNQLNTQRSLDRLIARSPFRYSGLNPSELLDSLTSFSDSAVTYIRPELGGVFGVSGQAVLADAIFIDGDTNNQQAGLTPNSCFAQAQTLPVPSMVGGFVNNPFAILGDTSQCNTIDDIFDVYRVSLSANQVINLNIGNAIADLDLYLYRHDDTSSAAASSIGVTPFETINVATAGDYYVVVNAYNDAANYALSFGQQTGNQNTKSAPEYVPGEIIVRMKNQNLTTANPSISRSAQAQQMANNLGLKHLGGESDREMLWKLADDTNQRQLSLQSLGAQSATKTLATPKASNLSADTLLAIKALRKRADVASADLNYIRRPSATPSDPYYPRQWHYPLISLPAAWNTSTGQDSIVAVIDTGVLLEHPDLQGQFVSGYDFISNPNTANDGNGIDPNPMDPGDNPSGTSSYHGTHVSGTIAAATNNSLGVAGVAWNAKIMPLRVLGVGGGTDYDITQAMRYAARLSNDSGNLPPRRADVINMSLGGDGSSSSTQLAINDVRAAGVIIVAAAGNDASNSLSYPAAYNGVVSVSAIDTQKHLAPYSNFGNSVDVAAPGGDTSVDRNGDGYADGILSTLASGSAANHNLAYTYQMYQGTSMATPHVAGVAALMKATNPSLTPDQFDTLLANGKLTEDIGNPGKDDQFGYGLINAQLAVNAVTTSTQPVAPLLGSAPSGLNFSANTSSLSLNLFNAGGGNLTVSLLQADQPWLKISPNSLDAHGLGSYTIAVDRSNLNEGTYSATITASSDGGNLGIPVLMGVGGSTTSDTGLSYFLLINNAISGSRHEVAAVSSQGVYQLNFIDIPKGEYWLLGGTDMDGDGILCADGELCGGYPSIEALYPITVTGNVSDLKFTANFTQSLQSTANLRSKLGPQIANKLLTDRGLPRIQNTVTKDVRIR